MEGRRGSRSLGRGGQRADCTAGSTDLCAHRPPALHGRDPPPTPHPPHHCTPPHPTPRPPGLGRAPATALAYMFWLRGFQLDAAYELLRSQRMCSPRIEAIRSATIDLLLGGEPVPVTIGVRKTGTATDFKVWGPYAPPTCMPTGPYVHQHALRALCICMCVYEPGWAPRPASVCAQRRMHRRAAPLLLAAVAWALREAASLPVCAPAPKPKTRVCAHARTQAGSR